MRLGDAEDERAKEEIGRGDAMKSMCQGRIGKDREGDISRRDGSRGWEY